MECKIVFCQLAKLLLLPKQNSVKIAPTFALRQLSAAKTFFGAELDERGAKQRGNFFC